MGHGDTGTRGFGDMGDTAPWGYGDTGRGDTVTWDIRMWDMGTRGGHQGTVPGHGDGGPRGHRAGIWGHVGTGRHGGGDGDTGGVTGGGLTHGAGVVGDAAALGAVQHQGGGAGAEVGAHRVDAAAPDARLRVLVLALVVIWGGGGGGRQGGGGHGGGGWKGARGAGRVLGGLRAGCLGCE